MNANIIKEREGMVMKIPSQNPFYQSSNFPKADIADWDSNYSGPSPYHLNYCGFEACHPGYAFGPHSRTSYLLHIVFSGKGKYYVEGKVYSIESGQIFLIYPGITTTYQADTEDPWSYGWVGFSGLRCPFILSQMGFSADNHVITIANIEPLRACIQSMMDTHKLTYANELYRTSHLLHFFAYIIEQQSDELTASRSYPRSVYAQLAMQYIENNYMNKIKITELADYIGVDRSHLTKSFHEEYHVSPQEYLIRLRMEKAEYLLTHTSQPISIVAHNVGYSDALAFSKIFRQRFGLSPSDYREAETTVTEATVSE